MGIIYPGNIQVPRACGGLRTENPFDFQPDTQIYRQRMMQIGRYFRQLPISSPFQNVDEEQPILSGTWTLTYIGQKTSNIAVNATAAQVQAALQALSTIGANNVVVTGDFANGYVAEFAAHAGLHAAKNILQGNAFGITPAYTIATRLMLQASGGGKGAFQSIKLAPVDTSNSTGAFLVQETAREDQGNGVVKWDRVYANVPQTYVEYQGYNYQKQTMQTIRIPWSGTTDLTGHFQGTYRTLINLAEFNEPLTAQIAYSFVLGQNKLGRKKAPFYIPYRIIHYTDSFGYEHTYSVGTWGLAEATSATRWMGDIWQIRNVYVNPY